MSNKYDKYISTTLPYANSVPHIGHTLEFVQADSLVKYFKNVQKENVFFNLGVDENGLKVYTKSQELGIDTKEYLDSLASTWKDFCNLYEIGYDNFYRTTDTEHHNKVKELWSKLLRQDDIYLKSYIGLYCIGCESFKTESELVDGCCVDHGKAPVQIEEENYFFRITKYKSQLLEWYNREKYNFLQPVSKITELENIINGSEDISISRLKKNVPWGVDVPNDPDHVIYVWLEALSHYTFAIDNFNAVPFIQLCGGR
jgi:methionyl-tRNA synthetase